MFFESIDMSVNTVLEQVKCQDVEIEGFHCKYISNDPSGRIPDEVLKRMKEFVGQQKT